MLQAPASRETRSVPDGLTVYGVASDESTVVMQEYQLVVSTVLHVEGKGQAIGR